jgi:hypothetical protein
MNETTSDSHVRRALLGTWRLVSFQFDVDGTPIKPLGDDPQGYLVYTPDRHVFVADYALRKRPGQPLTVRLFRARFGREARPQKPLTSR